MRHVNDAKNKIESGNSHEALEIIENLLDLAPQNHEAMRLKALILDSHGRFDESLIVLRELSRLDGISPQTLHELEKRSYEEREVSIYSELTTEGRWYFSFPGLQVWISLFGFIGCALFLLVSPGLLGQGVGQAADAHENLFELVFAFLIFVALPWILLMVVHLVGIKKVLVGMSGLKICTRFSEKNVPWETVSCAVLEHSANMKNGDLFLVLYGPRMESPESLGQGQAEARGRSPLVRFNVSEKKCVVRARRHFVRSVLAHVDSVSYVALEPLENIGISLSSSESETAANASGGARKA